MGKVKAWLMELEEEAQADIVNHDNIDSYLQAWSKEVKNVKFSYETTKPDTFRLFKVDEETLREYWSEFQSDHVDIVYE